MTLPVVLLSACDDGVAVDVVQAGSTIEVGVTPRSSLATPCVERIVVYRDGNEATAIWQLSQADEKSCVDRFTIGMTPKGFQPGVPSRAPVPGVTYRVDVSGSGFRGRTTFVARNREGRIGLG